MTGRPIADQLESAAAEAVRKLREILEHGPDNLDRIHAAETLLRLAGHDPSDPPVTELDEVTLTTSGGERFTVTLNLSGDDANRAEDVAHALELWRRTLDLT